MTEETSPTNTCSLNSPVSETSPDPPENCPRLESSNSGTMSAKGDVISIESRFAPNNLSLVTVLRNDTQGKCIFLHARLVDSPGRDAIIILEKSAFPNDSAALKAGGVVCSIKTSDDADTKLEERFINSNWRATSVTSNDVYNRLLVTAGLEPLNSINATIIYPAEGHHFKRYSSSGRRVLYESPKIYHNCIVPFLKRAPRDLSWVDNVLNGTAEKDRVLYSDPNEQTGFIIALDFRWDEKRLQELHCLALARDRTLTCLRELRARHVPMLEAMWRESVQRLVDRYRNDKNKSAIEDDQLLAYLHYPPTFYRLHVHIVHADTSDNTGTRAGRAHLLDEVIQNLKSNDLYYAERVMTMYSYDSSPMLAAWREWSFNDSQLKILAKENEDQKLSAQLSEERTLHGRFYNNIVRSLRKYSCW